MRLEYTPHAVVRIVLRSLERRFDLCRVMRVVVYYRHAAESSLVFETAVGAGEGQESFFDGIHRYVEKLGHRDGSQRIGDIVVACYRKGDAAGLLAVLCQVERDMSFFIIRNV